MLLQNRERHREIVAVAVVEVNKAGWGKRPSLIPVSFYIVVSMSEQYSFNTET